jgi:hypothetical protein
VSDLTPCNYCNYKDIKRRYKGQDILKVPGWHKGVDILVVPKGEEPDREKHFIAWFMELPDHCCCG